MAEKNKEQRLSLAQIVFLLSLFVVCIIIIVLITYSINKKIKVPQVMRDLLSEIGIDYYENSYYPKLANKENDIEDFLSKFQESGIKINLENLSKYNSNFLDISSKMKEFEKKKCNKANTIFIVYPQMPFEKTDYTYKAIIDCQL